MPTTAMSYAPCGNGHPSMYGVLVCSAWHALPIAIATDATDEDNGECKAQALYTAATLQFIVSYRASTTIYSSY